MKTYDYAIILQTLSQSVGRSSCVQVRGFEAETLLVSWETHTHTLATLAQFGNTESTTMSVFMAIRPS